MSKSRKVGKPKANRGNALKREKSLRKNEALLSKLKKGSES